MLSYGAFSHGFSVSYFSTQHTPSSLIGQMGSIGLDPSTYFGSGVFKITELPEFEPGINSSAVLEGLAERISNLQDEFRFAIVDAVSSLVTVADDAAVLAFFSACKKTSNRGKSVILSVDPVGLTEDTLFRVRAMCDGYLAMRLEKSGARLNNILEVCKVRHAEELTGNIVNFAVDPGLGIKVDATYHVSA